MEVQRTIRARDLHEDYDTTLRDHIEIEAARHNHLENKCVLRGIVRAFKILKREADNGFGNLDFITQIERRESRIRQIGVYLYNTCFYEEDLIKIRNKIDSKIRKIYEPYMKQPRKTDKITLAIRE